MNGLFRSCFLPAAALALAACSTPVEFSASANPPSWNDANADADFSGILDLPIRTAQRGCQAGCGHRAGDTDFSLAPDFGAGDRGVHLAQRADRGSREKERRDLRLR